MRNAIARSVQRGADVRIKLEWPRELSSAPLKTTECVARALGLAKDLGLAFKDRSGINPNAFSLVSVSDWSNRWQAELVDSAAKLKSQLADFSEHYRSFFQQLTDLEPAELDEDGAVSWVEVARTCIASIAESVRATTTA